MTNQPHSLRLYDASVPLFAVSLLLVLVVTRENQVLFLVLNEFTQRLPDGLWSHWTVFGDALLLLVLTLPWVGRRPELVWTMWLAALLVTLVVHALKPWVSPPRPPAVLDPAVFRVIGDALRSGSFPSGHTAAAFAYAGVVALHLRRAWVTALLLAAAAGVGVSRMAVGAHWPADVLAGAAIGWAGACAAFVLARRWHWGMTPRGQRVLTSLLLIAGGVLLWGYDTGYPAAAAMQRVLALACLVAAVPGVHRVFAPHRAGG